MHGEKLRWTITPSYMVQAPAEVSFRIHVVVGNVNNETAKLILCALIYVSLSRVFI